MERFFREYLDMPVERRGTQCEKWDKVGEYFGNRDAIPLWVADMDFRTVPEVIEALEDRARHGIFGYTDDRAAAKEAEIGWIQRRYGLKVNPEWIVYSPGVVDSLFFAVQALTQPGDPVVVQSPVYGPFYSAVKNNGRTLVENRMIETERGWKMDLDNLEKCFSEGARMMILCNPHNPVGRVWTRTELEEVAALAKRYQVIIVADEIHADFNYGDIPHTRILSVPGSERFVMLTSATKSFNLAGLRQSSAIIPDPEIRKAFCNVINAAHAGSPNIFGELAQKVAYTKGDAWMDAVREYIGENRATVLKTFAEETPQVKIHRPEGTYLVWLDLSGFGYSSEEMNRKLIHEAGVALSEGTFFGAGEGSCSFRMNIATTHANVEEALDRMIKMLRGL